MCVCVSQSGLLEDQPISKSTQAILVGLLLLVSYAIVVVEISVPYAVFI